MNLQFIVDGILTGAMIGLGAIGVTLTYSILRFSNFAHGEFISWGAYLALGLSGAIGWATGGSLTPLGPFSFGWGLILATAVAMLLTGLLALALDFVLFRHLRQKAAAITVVMASFGASMALRSLLEFLFTSRPALFQPRTADRDPHRPWRSRHAGSDRARSVVTAVLVISLHLLLTRTQIGRSMRAVSENPALARVAGIDVAAVDQDNLDYRRRARLRLGRDGRLARADPALHGLRSAAAAVRRRDPRRHRQRSRRACRRPDRRRRRGRRRCRRSVANGAPLSPSCCSSRCCSSARPACSERGLMGGFLDLGVVGYAAFFLATALSYAVICLGLNLQWGQTGLFNVGVAGFVGIGAYASALLTTPATRRILGGFGAADRRRLVRRDAAAGAASALCRRCDAAAPLRLSRHHDFRRRRGHPSRRAQRAKR